MATNLKKENRRLTATNHILSRALGTAISLLQAIVAAETWDDFTRLRNEIQPALTQITTQLQSARPPTCE